MCCRWGESLAIYAAVYCLPPSTIALFMFTKPCPASLSLSLGRNNPHRQSSGKQLFFFFLLLLMAPVFNYPTAWALWPVRWVNEEKELSGWIIKHIVGARQRKFSRPPFAYNTHRALGKWIIDSTGFALGWEFSLKRMRSARKMMENNKATTSLNYLYAYKEWEWNLFIKTRRLRVETFCVV